MSLREGTRPGLGIIEPCLPSPAKGPPSGPGWLHEIKHDGFRILARRDNGGVIDCTLGVYVRPHQFKD
jgi:ATP-dependent DNA ligase